MDCKIVSIPTEHIHDWSSFHDVFKEVLGFPDFYGRNMNAWVDCMCSIDHTEHKMSEITIDQGNLLVLNIEEAADFKRRCPEQYEALIECAERANSPVIESPVLALLLSGHFKRA
jgi:RNAse (barnase) inhibitor barstar